MSDKINLNQLSEIESLTNMLDACGLVEKGYSIIAKGNFKRYKIAHSMQWRTYTEMNEFLRGYLLCKQKAL